MSEELDLKLLRQAEDLVRAPVSEIFQHLAAAYNDGFCKARAKPSPNELKAEARVRELEALLNAAIMGQAALEANAPNP